MTKDGWLRRVESEIFEQYDIDKLEQSDRCDFHAMTSEHTEILGQFLDYSAKTPDELKRCLLLGYLESLTDTVRLKQDEYEDLIGYKSMYEELHKACVAQRTLQKYTIYEVRSEMWECDKKHFPNQLAFRIQWVANVGFGELTFIYNTKTNTWSVDEEHMSEEFCKAVLFKWLNGVYTGENAVSKLDYGE